MKSVLRPVLLALALGSCVGVAWSQTKTAPIEPGPSSEIEQFLVDGLTKAVNMISLAWGSVIPYALPEILPNGDIIIRHKSPKAPPMEEPTDFMRPSDDANQKPGVI